MAIRVRACRDCGTATERNPRCASCEATFQAARNASPARRAYTEPGYRAIPLQGSCALCGSTTDLTRHHLVEVRHAGRLAGGIVILCRSCNSALG